MIGSAVLGAAVGMLLQILAAVVKVIREQGAFEERAKQKERDDELEKKYADIARVGRDDVGTAGVLDEGKF